MSELTDKICSLLSFLYGKQVGQTVCEQVLELVNSYRVRLPAPKRAGLDQRDAILITYADQVRGEERAPLEVLANFCARHLTGVVSGIHVLPFYPWSSDDGFSVVDYRAVKAEYGSWDDLSALGDEFRLMFDAVINHISVKSDWFQRFLREDPIYQDYFILVEGNPDLSQVVRPRALPLLTRFAAPEGQKAVWTTFSTDQADLNYQNPDILLEIIDLLLYYIWRGADFIRLDAIAYLWKEIGTSCIHLPQTHGIIQLFRAVLDEVAPHVNLITETNVPHKDNLSYFGDGTNEAQMVYNFSLPPLVLRALQTGSAQTLAEWANGLELPSNRVTFFNFLASHDGIGLNPLRGILPESEISGLVDQVQAHGGLVSYKSNSDGTQSPYELNANYFDALNDPGSAEPSQLQVDRFLAAHAILLAFRGVPGVYFHSLFGSRGWPEGVRETGRSRSINRQKLEQAEVESELADPASRRARVFQRLAHLLRQRATQPAFHPHGGQRVLQGNPAIFGLLRAAPENGGRVLCLQNMTATTQQINIDQKDLDLPAFQAATDLVSGQLYPLSEQISLGPYQTLWLKL
jgi:glucosylglycerate phosphorylase